MKLYGLLLSRVLLITLYSCADEVIAHQESQTNGVKSATVIYVPKAKIKILTKTDRTKAMVKRKTKDIKFEIKDKIRRKLFVPQVTTNYNQTVVK